MKQLWRRLRNWRAARHADAVMIEGLFATEMAGVAETDLRTGKFTRVNARMCAMLGRSEAEVLTLGPADVQPPEDVAHIMPEFVRSMTEKGRWEGEVRHVLPDGEIVWARLNAIVVARDATGAPLRGVAVLLDTTEARRADAKVREQADLLRMGQAIGRIATLRRDVASGLIHADAAGRKVLALPDGDAPIRTEDWLETILPEDRDRVARRLRKAFDNNEPGVSLDYRTLCPRTGRLRYIELRARYSFGPDGKATTSIGVGIDVTERREAEQRLTHAANHDALTGLPNRALFRTRLEEALARARRGIRFALLCLDLDRFKEVNDTLGHPVGDRLLVAAAARLRAELRETDTLARLGGDEFAIIQCCLLDPQEASSLARRVINILSAPFEIDGQKIVVGVSIGIALSPEDSGEAESLLSAADMALYGAKADGRGVWRYFEPAMNRRLQERRLLELDMRRALAEGQFELFYQPIMDVETRRVKTFEALLRWRHPERGLLAPDLFIPVAEEIGLIVELGEWVLRRACADATRWPPGVGLAVNFSPVQFQSRHLVAQIAGALCDTGLSPGRLEIEITENVLIKDKEATLAILQSLKALGVRIAMDDFGTGYSSLSYLQAFPFDKVKIDRSFTCELDQSRKSNAIIKAVASMCDGLDMTVVAEGVETEGQFEALQREGCSEAQGFLFSRPVAADALPALLCALNGAPWTQAAE
ncbi:PAS domain S-box-containing protein/diguanylate cyclase (GGDEF) domain-containing protein [Rhodoblastus acidophilus]|uniref:PAS domain S-box-containing protein/diguanylate cyclase (GGDEF) domain-containing protein n=2 Tax=Rhodoblastus acidophilus TaxID=1074 RepID=A0A212Q966_RHOAC|nr:bifunctional diguanylate cyclase/phosphodiesterase [Rhodoblastus acidophilus]RAI21108.1 bifunctional diguanylate cyclase/phosphodiesterase [Rhodoblastus acidophilus]SNB55911.1 PAS domain S-box-containing protein/diguanylate cyclase (GGDEF) domain-containing protein [Rhodoblastus acidophilus]